MKLSDILGLVPGNSTNNSTDNSANNSTSNNIVNDDGMDVSQLLTEISNVFIKIREQKREQELNELQERHQKERAEEAKSLPTILENMLGTFQVMYLELLARKPGQAFRVVIPGIVDSDMVKPTVEYWSKCNPAKFNMVKVFSNMMRSKGWSPGLELSVFGTDLIFTCDFDDK